MRPGMSCDPALMAAERGWKLRGFKEAGAKEEAEPAAGGPGRASAEAAAAAADDDDDDDGGRAAESAAAVPSAAGEPGATTDDEEEEEEEEPPLWARTPRRGVCPVVGWTSKEPRCELPPATEPTPLPGAVERPPPLLPPAIKSPP